jgi:hypothetical protein
MRDGYNSGATMVIVWKQDEADELHLIWYLSTQWIPTAHEHGTIGSTDWFRTILITNYEEMELNGSIRKRQRRPLKDTRYRQAQVEDKMSG